MKKGISLLLTILLILSQGAVPAVMADNVEELQQAVVETALAYYYKGLPVQYDSTQMSAQSRMTHGESRTTSAMPPEWASRDNTLYSVCSDFVFSVYYNALGIEICGGSRGAVTASMSQNMNPNDSMLVYYYGGQSGNYDMNSLLAAENLLLPGDILTYYRKSNGGHAAMCVGDWDRDGKVDLIHCNGSKLDMSTGKDTIEKKNDEGAVRVVSAQYLLFGKNSIEKREELSALTILRPLKNQGLTLTPAARTRLQYPGIEVDRKTNLWKYNSTKTGDNIVVTVDIKNNGTQRFQSLQVTEPPVAGVVIDEESVTEGGRLTAGGVKWTLNMAPGEELSLQYTAKVTAGTGEKISFPSGTVDNLTTRPMEFLVGGAGPDETKLAAVGRGQYGAALRNLQYEGDLDFVNAFYRDILGVEMDLPKTIQAVVDNMFTPTKIEGVSSKLWGGKMLVPKKRESMSQMYQRLDDMVIPEHKAGWIVYTRDSLTEVPKMSSAQNRVIEIVENFYEPGDIFFGYIHKDGKSFTVYQPDVFIYLGGGKAVGWSRGSGVATVDTFENTIGLLLRTDVLFALRPDLARNTKGSDGDINGDGVVTTKDVTALRRYIAGGYDVECVESSLDVNGDGVVTTKDVTMLRRYIAGGYGVELK